MRFSGPVVLAMVVAASSGTTAPDAPIRPPQQQTPPAAPEPISRAKPKPATALTPELRAKILSAMRLNRQAFQEDAVLKRYGQSSSAGDASGIVACDLPRTSSGGPAAHYQAAKARTTPRPYTEVKVADCLGTTGGLSGTRASPLVQHYYCSLPGLSPDIRGCFTFQLRLPRVSRTRSTWEEGFLADGTKLPLQKGWNFLGPDPAVVPGRGEGVRLLRGGWSPALAQYTQGREARQG